jgi:hypothetical protein
MCSIGALVAAALLLASPEAAAQRGYADVNGVKLYYEVHGAGAPVVLLHGGINTLEATFAKLMPMLSSFLDAPDKPAK